MVKLALYKQIYQDIKDQIVSRELRPKDRVPSEQEIMDAYKVSKITVKNALAALADEGLVVRIQGKGTFVSPEPNLAGAQASAAVQPNEAMLVGFIIPTMKTRVIQKLVDQVEYYLQQFGYQMILRITRESSIEETKAIRELTDLGVKGFIVFPTEDEKYNESLLRLSLDKFPFVFIDRFLRNIETYTITSDNMGGAYQTVSYLLDKGHREIALISPDNVNTAIEDRTAGFEKAYIDQGVSIDKNLWCHVPLHILRSRNAQAYITDFLRRHSSVTAVFALTAEVANLTKKSLAEIHAEADRVELFSFDNPEIPHVPYVMQQEEKMAEAAVKLLHSQMKNKYDPQQIVIPIRLVVE